MSDRPSVVSVTRTCMAMPSQWEGLLSDGSRLYGRYRWSCFELRQGPTMDDAVFGHVGRVLLSERNLSVMDGDMSDRQFLRELARVFSVPVDLRIDNADVAETEQSGDKAWATDDELDAWYTEIAARPPIDWSKFGATSDGKKWGGTGVFFDLTLAPVQPSESVSSAEPKSLIQDA